ncbi:TPA: (galactosaminyl)2-N,N'-diacetylbacillosaminyl-alpha1-diphospho-di-trans,octa-cis-undecaprenol synthase PglE [Neisseria gonorrhoeae]|uniref:(galactosaminyl)2-N, N'-diacetylbacillosaminyl-alpha1-diphospho-di-trans, octa-cis-undecaprenol synthase PglE n=1 Tax=Neisseria gonorrhoeae TaxID=485 RepID=UPI003ABA5BB4
MNLSIVVPIYNVESYLEACLNSIEPILSNENVELILVNDGSKDGSEDICYKYIDKISNIKHQTPNTKYIYQDNQGLSEARNTGIKNSNGKYIAFIDSDDFINCQVLLDFLGKDDSDMPDVVFLNAVKYDKGRVSYFGEDYQPEKILNQSKVEVLKGLCRFRKFPGSAWNKIIKRELIIREKLFFEKGIYSEDIEWSMRLFNAATTFSYLDGCYYYYRQGRKDSITGTVSEKGIKSLLYILEKNAKMEFNRDISSYLYSFLSYEYLVLLFIMTSKNIACDSDIKRRAYHLRFMLLKSNKLIYKLIFPIITLFGVDITGRILKAIRGNI